MVVPRVYYVLSQYMGWEVKEHETTLTQHDTKALAVEHGLQVAMNQKPGQLVSYSADGDIEAELHTVVSRAAHQVAQGVHDG